MYWANSNDGIPPQNLAPAVLDWITSNDGIPPRHRLIPSNIISLYLPLLLLMPVCPVDTMFFGVSLLFTPPKNNVQLFLKAAYTVLLPLAFSRQPLLVTQTVNGIRNSRLH